MNNVVHFNMILEINQLLKQNNIEYSIHSIWWMYMLWF